MSTIMEQKTNKIIVEMWYVISAFLGLSSIIFSRDYPFIWLLLISMGISIFVLTDFRKGHLDVVYV